jgi:hypothetical protein
LCRPASWLGIIIWVRKLIGRASNIVVKCLIYKPGFGL